MSVARPLRSLLLAAVTALTVLALPATAGAATNTWDGSTNSTWLEPANWSDGVPTSDDDVVIPEFIGVDTPISITAIPASVNVTSFVVRDAGEWEVAAQALTSASTTTITTTGTIDLGGGTYTGIGFTIGGAGTSGIFDGFDETIDMNGGAITIASEVLLNIGTVEAGDGTGNNLDLTALTTAPGSTVRIINSTYLATTTTAIGGELSIDSDANLYAGGGSFAKTGIVSTSTGFLRFDGTTVNSSDFGSSLHLRFANGSNQIASAATVLFGGDTVFTAGASIGANANVTFSGSTGISDNVFLGGGATITLANTATLDVSVGATGAGFVAMSTNSLVNNGEIRFQDTDVAAQGGNLHAVVTGTGDISIEDGLAVNTGGQGVTINTGRLSLSEGSEFAFTTLAVTGTGRFTEGALSGHGTFTGVTTVGDDGVVQPAQGAGPSDGLTFDNLTIGANATLSLVFSSPSVYSRLTADGVNDGTIRTDTEGGYVPAEGVVFPVVVDNGSGALTDTFASVDNRNFVQSATGYYLTQAQAGTGLSLTSHIAAVTIAAGGYPGGSVTVAGTNFVPNEPLSVDVFNVQAGSFNTVQATASGTGSFSVVVPLSSSFVAGSIIADAYGATSTAQVRGMGTLVATPTCATGQTGAFPNCVTPLPATCGTGQTGTPPNCVTPAPPVSTKPSAGPDNITGSTGNNVIRSGAGNDRVNAGAGNDTVDGGLGNDTLFGGLGIDKVLGGAGNDTASGGAGNDLVDGGAGNDKVNGEAGNDKVAGGIGNDTAHGGAGNDVVTCGTGIDKAYGDAGNDTLTCRDGKPGDTIVGGPGVDRCIGDRGDRFLSCERISRT